MWAVVDGGDAVGLRGSCGARNDQGGKGTTTPKSAFAYGTGGRLPVRR
jgi:hypothetical protein